MSGAADEEAQDVAPRIDSPCVGVCLIDEDTGLCEGCLRTLEEVAAWSTATPSQRHQILNEVRRRAGHA